MDNIMLEGQKMVDLIIPKLDLHRIHKKKWATEIPELSISKGSIIYQNKSFKFYELNNKFYWMDFSSQEPLYGVIIPQHHGTQYRILMKQENRILTMYASLRGTYSFQVKNLKSGQIHKFTVKYKQVEEAGYLVGKCSLQLCDTRKSKELPYIRGRLITISDKDEEYLGFDIQFIDKLDGLGRLRLKLNNLHEIIEVKGWYSSMAEFDSTVDFTGTCNCNEEIYMKHVKLMDMPTKKLDMNVINQQITAMLEEEPLYVETLYTIPQPLHLQDIMNSIQDELTTLAYAFAPDFVLDFIRVERPSIRKEYEDIVKDEDVKKFLETYMMMYMNSKWANNKNLDYSEYVRTVEQYQDRINYYWCGTGETSMAKDKGYMKLIDVIQVSSYFRSIPEIKPFLNEKEKWSNELYNYARMQANINEVSAAIEHKENTKSNHLKYMFKYLSDESKYSIDTKNCCSYSGEINTARKYDASTSLQYIILNTQLSDSILFLEGMKFPKDKDKMYMISKLVLNKFMEDKPKELTSVSSDDLLEIIEYFYKCIEIDPMLNTSLSLKKTMEYIDNQQFKMIIFITVIAMWNDQFTKLYQGEEILSETQLHEVYDKMINGVLLIVKNNQNLYSHIFDITCSKEEFYNCLIDLTTSFQYTQAISNNVHQDDAIFHFVEQQQKTKNLKSGIVSDMIMVVVDLCAAFLSIYGLEDSDNLHDDVIIKSFACVSIAVDLLGIFLIGASIKIMDAVILTAIPYVNVILAITGVCCTIIEFIIGKVTSKEKVEYYAKDDCVECLKSKEVPEQDWIDKFNESFVNKALKCI